ncbi:FecCD family ABC transporter permease [Nonomuraea typhae]|uniref:FecCD family ABC transporter permease n=1 Tax=Nonomuraea typhae TaxID=2603600 RepID=UPI001FE37780|nr:iron chelate uptake ABC transporter family permease subunit [Nonomuraea typhae]
MSGSASDRHGGRPGPATPAVPIAKDERPGQAADGAQGGRPARAADGAQGGRLARAAAAGGASGRLGRAAVPPVVWLFGCVVLLLAAVLLSLMVGAAPISPGTVLTALAGEAHSVEARTVLELRVPRTILALAAGAGLAVAGALIQALTRNPLADPGILGVNAGAGFAVALAVAFLGVSGLPGRIAAALAGAAAAAAVVYLLGSMSRTRTAGPITLVLVGLAFGAVLQGLAGAITMLRPQAFTLMRHWETGALNDRTLAMVVQILPLIGVGLAVAFVLAPSLNAVVLGDGPARALGVRLGPVRAGVVVAVTLLCGATTALAGPIGFAGLMIPHVVRWLFGVDQRWIAAFSAVLGAVLLLVADTAGRVVLWPGELPAGIVTAFVGAPFLIVLARRKEASGL